MSKRWGGSNSRLFLFWLASIILLSAFLRLFLLSQIPPGFFCDEASNGYDAYCLLLTHRDQYGKFFPFFTRAFGDYRETLYIFLTIPFIKFLGLHELATRLPAALIGTLTVFILYLLGKEFFDWRLGCLSALFLAISPWHIQFSRVAFRAILFPLFFCLALFLFFKSLKSPSFLWVSALVFGLSLYTYPSARIFVPLFLLILMIIYRQQLLRVKKETIMASLLFLFIFIVLLRFWVSPEGRARAVATLNLSWLKNIENYFSYFAPPFLFLSGDPNLRHSPLGVGEVHLFEVITILAGIFFLLKDKGEIYRILLPWLLLYPLPAALTAPKHALRAIIGAPLFALLSGYGVIKLGKELSPKIRRYFNIGILFLGIISMTLFLKNYLLEYPRYSAPFWQYGMREAITFSEETPYERIVVSDSFFLPHIFILFYTQYPPEKYQTSPLLTLSQGNWQYTDYSLGKYYITTISRLDLRKPCLVILKPEEIGKIPSFKYYWHLIQVVKDPYGREIIYLVEVKPKGRGF